MSTFFLVLEVLFIYVFALYVMAKKADLAILYLPAIFFADSIIVPTFPALFYYGMVSMVILQAITRNQHFYRYNGYAILLIFYFGILLLQSKDLVLIRPYIFAITWLFILVPLIASVYQRYSRQTIITELGKSSFVLLCLFILNSIFSTYYKYAPREMYGITKGILYGNLLESALNPLALALFVLLLVVLRNRNLLYSGVFFVSLFLVILTLRRSVIAVSLFGAMIGTFAVMAQKQIKMILFLGVFGGMALFFVYHNTDFLQQFKERVELRKLDERSLEEEKRFIEYELLYEDMFVYNRYSPLFGYGPFDSAGNYGNGVMDERTLHGDLTNIVHSSGFIGLGLYLLMAGSAFLYAYRSRTQPIDRFIVLFCALAFAAYTATGRYTSVAAMSLLYMILMIPTSEEVEDEEEETEAEGTEEEEQTQVQTLIG